MMWEEREEPDRHHDGGERDPFVLYQRAKAQLKAGRPDAALASIQAARTAIHRLRLALRRSQAWLYPASVKTARGTKWGYINQRGRMVLPPQFDQAEEFQENGLAVVMSGGKSGVINQSGRYVVPLRYGTVSPFSEGRATVTDDRGMWVIDEQGRILTSSPHSYISPYQEGRAVFSDAEPDGSIRYGYLDRQGNVVIPAQFLGASDFSGGKAVVQLGESMYALIGPDGEQLHRYPYPYVGQQGDGLLPFQQIAGGPYGYLDESGQVVIQPRFTSAEPFEDGRAVVNTSTDPLENRYALISRTGAFVIPPAYNSIRQLGAGRVAAGQARMPQQPYAGSLYALAETSEGRLLTDFRWQEVGEFQGRVASVTDGRSTFFIDRSGQVVRSLPIVPGAGSLALMGPLVQASVNNRISYYNRSGRLVWRQNPVIPLTRRWRIREEIYNPTPNYLVYYPQIEGMRDRLAQIRVNDQLKQWSAVPMPAGFNPEEATYTGDFSVTFFQKYLVVLELSGYNFPFGAAHGMPTRMHANIDLDSGRIYALADLFRPGSDYVRVLSVIVGQQIATDPQYSYVFPDAYKGIRPDQPFYVTAEALHLYFAPYEIAPFAAGFPTFTIPFVQIADIIDREGAFWQSFHK